MVQIAKPIAIALLCLTFASAATAQPWTRFRGPNGSGISTAATVPVKWSDKDYNWRVKLPGVGHSSPVLWGTKLFATCGDEETGQRIVLCLNAKDGQQLWSRKFDAAHHRKHKLNSFASATPAVDKNHVYICWGTPDEFVVVALDHAGSEVWRKQLGPFKSGHGDGVSPIVYDNLVVVPIEHNGDSSLVALDCKLGDIRWRVPREGKSNYYTPCVFRRDGKTDELIFTNWTAGITAVDPTTGKINWEANVFDKGHTESTISSPIVTNDLVLGLSGWMGVRQELIAVRPKAVGDSIKAEQIYCIDRSVPLCVTPLVKDDLLFLWADEGIVTCADVSTGKLHWRKRVRGAFYASPICVDNKIYNISTDGEVIVLAASRNFRELARNSLGEPSHATPAVAEGVMYLRTFSHLYSIGGKP